MSLTLSSLARRRLLKDRLERLPVKNFYFGRQPSFYNSVIT